MRIGIVGVGVVGGATARAMEHCDHIVARWDPNKRFFDDLSVCDLIFVCVPTENREHAVLRGAMAETVAQNEHAIIAIRSTVCPGTTDEFCEIWQRPIVYVPEFLREKFAGRDALMPDKLVVGARESKWAEPVVEAFRPLSIPPRNVLIMRPLEAELAKLALNALALLKVVYANELYDLARALGAHYGEILKVFAADRNVNPRHLDPLADGYRGAGGKCLPKDTDFLVQIAREHGIPLHVLTLAAQENRNLLYAAGLC